MVRITRRLEIDSGHRLMKHEGKCRNYHGHRYVFEATVEGPGLDEVGRIVDFSVIKERLGGWLDTHWDHGMILQVGDPMIAFLMEQADPKHGAGFDLDGLGFMPSPKLYVMGAPPTAENMAAHFFTIASGLLPPALKLAHLRVCETPNCWADDNGG